MFISWSVFSCVRVRCVCIICILVSSIREPCANWLVKCEICYSDVWRYMMDRHYNECHEDLQYPVLISEHEMHFMKKYTFDLYILTIVLVLFWNFYVPDIRKRYMFLHFLYSILFLTGVVAGWITCACLSVYLCLSFAYLISIHYVPCVSVIWKRLRVDGSGIHWKQCLE